jgi:prophage regulatory protein
VFDSIPDAALLRLPQVKALTGLSRASIYRLCDTGDFPSPHKISERAIAWRWSELRTWLDAKARQQTLPLGKAGAA